LGGWQGRGREERSTERGATGPGDLSGENKKKEGSKVLKRED